MFRNLWPVQGQTAGRVSNRPSSEPQHSLCAQPRVPDSCLKTNGKHELQKQNFLILPPPRKGRERRLFTEKQI